MSIRLRAFLYAVGVFASIFAGAFALNLIFSKIPSEWYYPMFMSAVFAVLFGTVYSVVKAHLEFNAKLQEINNRKSTT